MEGERAARELKLTIKNIGVSPAQLQAVSAREVLQEYGSPARENPKYGEEETPATRLLVPNDSIGHFVQIETDYNMALLTMHVVVGLTGSTLGVHNSCFAVSTCETDSAFSV